MGLELGQCCVMDGGEVVRAAVQGQEKAGNT